MSQDEPVHGFKEDDPVCVEDGEGRRHPGIFAGENESASWFGGGPTAYVVHPGGKEPEVVSIFRIIPREDEYDAHLASLARISALSREAGLPP